MVVLGLFTAGFEVLFHGTVIRKAALPLKKDLDALDRDKLTYVDEATGKRYRYRMVGSAIQLEPEMVNELGTEDYVGWRLQAVEDGSMKPVGEPLMFFASHYTGKPDQVPHVAEQCMLGNGYTLTGSRVIEIDVPGLPDKDRTVPLSVLFFKRGRQGQERTIVLYTFRTNDVWKADRDGVRWVLSDVFVPYAYFSKVEISIALPPDMPERAVNDGIESATRFLRAALPILMREHWPDLPTDNRTPGNSSTETGGA